jgi:acetate kinase
MGDRVLVLNAGSSTLKGSLIDRGREAPVAATTVEWGGGPDVTVEDAELALASALDALDGPVLDDLTGIGHRVVHGGPALTAPVVVDDESLAIIESATALAPLHVPPAVAVIRAVGRLVPAARQVACFDTAFHAARPDIDRRYPVPESWATHNGIRRYGFHGLSVDWASGRAAALLGERRTHVRLVVAHLGAGSSVTAVDRGRSVHTSMGYTPLEGLMMATRSGSIDPGVVFALARGGRYRMDDLEDALQHRSGLLAIGGTSDMRTLVEWSADGDVAAGQAIEMYVDRAAAGIAAAASRLADVDAIVFTGGIGEHAHSVRAAVVRRLAVLGVEPIAARKSVGEGVLSRKGRRPAVVCVAAREDLVIAEAVWRASRRRPAPVARSSQSS